MTLIKAFNNHLMEFIEDLIRIYPEDLDIRTSKTFIQGIVKINPKLILNYYYQNIAVLYKTQIDNGDITFFINKDYENDLGTEWKTSKIHNTMERWKNVLKNSNEDTQKKAMKYFQNLSKLSELYFKS